MQKILSFTYREKEYQVIIDHKSLRRKSIRFRLRNGAFLISAPYTVSDKYIMKLLEEKYAPMLIAKEKPAAVGDDFIYLFGTRHDFPEQGEFPFSNGEILKYKNKENFDKKIKKFFLKIITERVRYYEHLMKLEPHNVRVRNMSTRYGSNSKKTRTVTFALSLYSYSYQIIDSIIVHELAHTYYFDHSPNFYKVVYNFCPNYKELHKKLRKGEFQ